MARRMSSHSVSLGRLIFAAFILVFISGNRIVDISFEDLQNASFELTSNYANVLSAEKLYGIPKVSENGFECSPAIIRISRMLDLDQDTSRPQVLISGEIHGDERVGPLASILTSQLLVWSARCIIDKDSSFCEKLDKLGDGITVDQRRWLAFLATRRDTIIIPAANCIGHKFRKRGEGSFDPNRDFGYSRRDSRCFMSGTARIFHEIMKRNIIQIVVTFHGGMVALGYEWGSRNHPSPRDQSPDEVSHRDIAYLMRDFGGGFANEKPYPVGRINSLIYPVDGGMEDWLYAAGWDKSIVQNNCAGLNKNERYVGYFKSGSQNSFNLRKLKEEAKENVIAHGNRALVFLVETSNAKAPHKDSLGGYNKLLDITSEENGHVPRNVRLSLTAIDMVEPYTCFHGIHTHRKSHKKGRSLQVETVSNVMVNTAKKKDDSREERHVDRVETLLGVDWYVGGAHSVQQTFLVIYDTQPSKELEFDSSILSTHTSFPMLISPYLSGNSRWFTNDTQSTTWMELPTIKSSFHHTIDFSNISLSSGRYWIVAWSVVDQEYGAVGQGFPETSGPQSYFSNLRTNPMFSCEPTSGQSDVKNPRTCHGRRYWASDSIEIEVSNNGGSERDKLVNVVSAIKDCAWWESKTITIGNGKKYDSHEASQSKDIHDAVEESISFIAFETKYIMMFVGVLIFISVASMIASYWRRLRIYTALANNPYLNLPTGFQRL